MDNINFTEGKIVKPLLKFVGPVLFALFLQAMYGAVDLLIVGRFGESIDVSAVSTGSMIMMTLTNLFSSLAMGMTIMIGAKIGEKHPEEGGRIVGSGIAMFFVIGVVFFVLMFFLANVVSTIMQAPQEAFDATTSYIRICGTGMVIIIFYNLIGSVFRGIGDSKTPLITVFIACIFNIFLDLLMVAVFKMGARGAAIATVCAQFVSVVASIWLIRRKKLPFVFKRSMIRWDANIIGKIFKLGTPIAMQDFLVGISFLIVLAIVNSLGLDYSAGVGVAEKVCGFIMLVPLSFMQSMSAFVAQNRGANKPDRAVRGLWSAIVISTCFGILMFIISFFYGDLLSGIFSNDDAIVAASFEYLKAYAVDCLFTCFLFCFIGFFNGMEYTKFVMAQGIMGAFLVRVPVAYLMSKKTPVSLFMVGLATPASTLLQITLCFICFAYWKKKGL